MDANLYADGLEKFRVFAKPAYEECIVLKTVGMAFYLTKGEALELVGDIEKAVHQVNDSEVFNEQ